MEEPYRQKNQPILGRDRVVIGYVRRGRPTRDLEETPKLQKTFSDIAPLRNTPTLTKKTVPKKSRVLLRSNVKKPRSFYAPTRFVKRKRHSNALTGVAVFVFALGIIATVKAFSIKESNSNHVLAENVVKSENSSAQTPSEDKPTQASIDEYVVSPDMPRLLHIPKLNVTSRIKRIGASSTSQLRAPANIFDSGWYEGSNKPGESGTVLIDGHISGPTKQGVFYDLKRLNLDDVIEIERGDGRIIRYKVVKKQSYPNNQIDMSAVLVSAKSGVNGLNLITCTGRFNVAKNEYEDRLVVYAVEI